MGASAGNQDPATAPRPGPALQPLVRRVPGGSSTTQLKLQIMLSLGTKVGYLRPVSLAR